MGRQRTARYVFFSAVTALCMAALLSAKDAGAGRAQIDGMLDSMGAGGASAALRDARAAGGQVDVELTPEDEYYLGRAVAATILGKYAVYRSPEAQRYLNGICHALAARSERPALYHDYCVAILDSDEINAFATSGGHILVTRGLLRCADSEDALAAVIAHEVAHILLRHSAEAVRKSRSMGAMMQASGAIALAVTDGDARTQASLAEFSASVEGAVSSLLNGGYAQSQELAADAKALALMADAGYDPRAMDSMLRLLEERSGAEAGVSGMGRTHPSPAMRRHNAAKYYGAYRVRDTTAARRSRFERMRSSF